MIRVPIRSIFSGCLDGGLDASEKWILVHVHEIFELAHVLHVLRLASLLWGLGLRMQGSDLSHLGLYFNLASQSYGLARHEVHNVGFYLESHRKEKQ